MTAVAAKRRTRDATPQVPRARNGQAACGEFLRASVADGVRWEQRCDGRLHGDDERHHPGVWVEVGPIYEIF